MKLRELLMTIDPNNLICLEEEDDEVIFCCELGSLTLGDLKPYTERKVNGIYSERYNAYYGRSGISIILAKESA